jgi:c-di-GMP-binding flagellar brake protein YcgR
MENESDYLINNPKIILEQLYSLFNSKCILSAHFGENNNAYMTAIIEIDAQKKLLKFDCAPTELLNKQLLNASKVLFRTQFEGIKVSFRGKSIKKSPGNQPAFEMPIPTALFWMQRRQFYRIKMPRFHIDSYCELAVANISSGQDALITETVRYQIADLSIKGFAFFTEVASDNNLLFKRGMVFKDCVLSLNDGYKGNISLTIQDITNIKPNIPNSELRIGCEFIEIPSACETAIQRYLQNLEIHLKNISP